MRKFLILIIAALAIGSFQLLSTTSEKPQVQASGDSRLTWSPPTLTNPETRNIGTLGATYNLDPGKDYIMKMPSTPVTRGKVSIVGGRNIHIIGGEFNIQGQPNNATISQRTMFLIKDSTGIVHIEGILGRGEDLSEGIQIDADNAIVQIQNVRIEHIHANDQVGFTDNHPDLIQTYGGVKELRLDKFTGSTDYQGFLMQPEYNSHQGPTRIKRTNIVGDPTARYLYWMSQNKGILDGPIIFEDFWVDVPTQRAGGLKKALWPESATTIATDSNGRLYATYNYTPAVTGRITEGLPPGGDFVPAGVAGIGYVSPGYQDGSPTPPPPTTPPTPPPPASVPQTPYGGTARTLPGVIQAEDFDEGGQSVSYNDTTVNNDGNSAYRNTGVDLRVYGSTIVVGHTVSGEWLEYTLNNPVARTYNLKLVSGTVETGRTITFHWNDSLIATMEVPQVAAWGTHLESTVNGIELPAGIGVLKISIGTPDVLNIDSFEFIQAEPDPIPPTPFACKGDYNTNQTLDISDFNIFAQNYKRSGIQCNLDMVGGDCYLNILDFQEFALGYKDNSYCSLRAGQSPYQNITKSLPVRIQAEDFDEGGQDISFNDTTANNDGNSTYRTTPVDLRVYSGNVMVANTFTGEWIEYTLNNPTEQAYNFTLNGGSIYTGRLVSLTWNGQQLGDVVVPQVAAWGNTAPITIPNVTIPAGGGVLRMSFETDYQNIDWIEFTPYNP